MTRCVLCSARPLASFVRRDRLEVVRCPNCGLGTIIEGAHDAAAAYDRTYTSSADLPPLTIERYDELLASLAPYRHSGRLLEIGFGSGDFLRRAVTRGWTVVGTETSGEAVRRAVSDGIDARLGERASADVPPASFDVVVLLEVIEHVVDFQSTLRDAREALRPGGVVLLSTPNADSITRRIIGGRWRIFAEEHRWYFSPRALRVALRAGGLSPVYIRSRNVYPPDIWGALFGQAARDGGAQVRAVTAGRLRQFTRRHWAGRALRAAVQAGLQATGSGDTLWALALRDE